MNSSIRKIVDVEMPTPFGIYQLHLSEEMLENGTVKEHLALVMGEIRNKIGVLTRMHSECCTGDVFGCQRCDCQDQLHEAMKMTRRQNEGVLLYLRQEGRGIGLANKLHAYRLQDLGLDTAEANERLGFAPDLRHYDISADMLRHLGVDSVRLLTNNMNKIRGLSDAGIGVVERVPLVIHSPIRDRSEFFRIKQKKLGHVFDTLGHRRIVDLEPINKQLPLSYPSLIEGDSSLPNETVALCDRVKSKCGEIFGSHILSILFQGSNMRGDGSLYESDFDYILIFDEESTETIEKISGLKATFPKCNFLYLTNEEYKSYPESARLQFFITRKVYGEFNLGLPPGRSALYQTALSYAVQIGNSIRPLLFEFLDAGADQKGLIDRAHICLKRVDDCFLRVLTLLKNGRFPLNRTQLLELSDENEVQEILGVLNRWYGGTVTLREVCEALKAAEKIIHDFLIHSS